MPPDYKIILNPSAGRGAGAQAREPIEWVLREAGIAYDLTETIGPGHPRELAREAVLAGYDVIVSVGGDGTAHEVVNGMVEAEKQIGDWNSGRVAGVLGLIPIGTGNDYAWRLGLPLNQPEIAARVLIDGRRWVVDLGEVVDEHGNMEVFNNHLGAGFEAATVVESLRIQRFRGLALYLAAIARVIPKYANQVETTVYYNGAQQTAPMLLVSVANGGRTGGGFRIAPDAQLDDGELDLVIGRSPNIPTTLYLLPHFMRGTHIAQTRYVTAARASSLIIEAPTGMPVHLDGEIYREDARRMTVSVLPGRLEVIASPDNRVQAEGQS